MVRERPIPGSSWITYIGQGLSPTFMPGELVEIKKFDNTETSFTWNTMMSSTPPRAALVEPTHFTYEEQSDYVPFYVELDETNLPAEIAVMVNGICKGATVVLEPDEMIRGYVLEDHPGDPVELVAWYGQRGSDMLLRPAVYNADTRTFGKRPLTLERGRYYYRLSLREEGGDMQVPYQPVTMSAAPNPFNPETTIRFDLPRKGDVDIEVYNVRGQRLKTIFHRTLEAGQHSVVWQGDNAVGVPLSSGVYFVRLSFDGRIVMRKLLMLK